MAQDPSSDRWLSMAALTLGAGALAGGLGWAYRDYRDWRALGPGGLPGNIGGWLRMTRLRMIARDPLAITPLLDRCGAPDDIAGLADLAPRSGIRPSVAPHPVPHRQLSDHAPEVITAQLQALFDSVVETDPDRIRYARSHYEKHNQAVMLQPDCCSAHACAAHGEIAHIHPSDGSMHMVLSPSDCRTVLIKGWGERHGIAGVAFDLPLTYTLIYAPRDTADIATIARILAAAIAYMSGSAHTHSPESSGDQGAAISLGSCPSMT